MTSKTIPAVLSIAGSDSSGGAGIQADIKTIAAHHLFAETAITALTAQNTTGVRAVLEATPEFVAQEIDAVFEDIPPAAVKIGMVSSAAIIETIAERLEHWGAKNIVVDPVMVATSGARLIDEGAVEALTSRLLPLATVITPNIMEAEALAERAIESSHDQALVAQQQYLADHISTSWLFPDYSTIRRAPQQEKAPSGAFFSGQFQYLLQAQHHAVGGGAGGVEVVFIVAALRLRELRAHAVLQLGEGEDRAVAKVEADG
ncbi:bifunctional hydroxymethylpyrimidine kinase/phosphomethylpyrimidine kinase, partial [uncultured Enorma sp.]|uniref:bifunctional hydroxymethylpyrimidine kinase/phosphomethylpyrimidine kinase n=1 Tax=uncultured Enorma sp. TaxID=1714346 RepID=UPI0025DF8402